jgi:excisionase family DNA binding protein
MITTEIKEFSFEQLPKAVTELFGEVRSIKQLIIEQNNKPQQKESEQLLTIRQAAELLTLSVPTLYGLVHQSAIPVMKKSKRLYFSRQDLINWVKAGRKKTLTEIDAETDAFLSTRKKKSGGLQK